VEFRTKQDKLFIIFIFEKVVYGFPNIEKAELVMKNSLFVQLLICMTILVVRALDY